MQSIHQNLQYNHPFLRFDDSSHVSRVPLNQYLIKLRPRLILQPPFYLSQYLIIRILPWKVPV